MKQVEGRITTEGAMILALREHFPSPEYALLPQVRNGTGYERSVRTADAIVMGLWPSRGVYLHGIEIKVSRSDWTKEKRNPEKAEEIARFCDFWSVAAGSESLVLDGELPSDWGLLVPNCNGKLRVKVTPKKRDSPTPITRLFLASLLRKTTEASAVFTDIDAEIKKRVDSELAQAKAQALRDAESKVKLQLDGAAKLRANILAFEEASGITLDRYSEYFNRQIGEAVKALRVAQSDLAIKRKLVDTERMLNRALEDMKSHRQAIESIWPDVEGPR